MSLAELGRRVAEHTLSGPQRPDFHHLLTLTTGDLWHVVDFNGYALRPGSWLWLRPGQVHQWGDLTRAEGTLILFQQDVLDPATAAAARVDDPHAPVLTTPVAADAEAVTMAAEHLSREFQALGHLPLEVHIAALRHLLAVLLLRLAHLTVPAGDPAPEADPTYLRFRDAVEVSSPPPSSASTSRNARAAPRSTSARRFGGWPRVGRTPGVELPAVPAPYKFPDRYLHLMHGQSKRQPVGGSCVGYGSG